MDTKPVCKDCPKRYPACQDTCPDRAEERRKIEMRRAKRYEEFKLNEAIGDLHKKRTHGRSRAR